MPRIAAQVILAFALLCGTAAYAETYPPTLMVVGRTHLGKLVSIGVDSSRNVVSAGTDGTIRFWDRSLNQTDCLCLPNDPTGPGREQILEVAFSLNSKFAAILMGNASAKQRVLVLELQTRRIVSSFRPRLVNSSVGKATLMDSPKGLSFDPSSEKLVIYSNSKCVISSIFGEPIVQLDDHLGDLTAVNFIHSNVVAWSPVQVVLWNENGKNLNSWQPSNRMKLFSVYPHKEGALLVCKHEDQKKADPNQQEYSVFIWSFEKKTLRPLLEGFTCRSVLPPVKGLLGVEREKFVYCQLQGNKSFKYSCIDTQSGEQRTLGFLDEPAMTIIPFGNANDERFVLVSQNGTFFIYLKDGRFLRHAMESSPLSRVHLTTDASRLSLYLSREPWPSDRRNSKFSVQFDIKKRALLFLKEKFALDLECVVPGVVKSSEKRGLDWLYGPKKDIFLCRTETTVVEFIERFGLVTAALRLDLDGTSTVFACDRGLFVFNKGVAEPKELKGHNARVNDMSLSKDRKFFATCSEDHTVKFWNAKSKELFATLYVAGADWVIWTPEGYYSSSPDGARLIGWQIDRGSDQFAEFVPAVHRRREFFRPDIVDKAFELASSAKSIEQLAVAERPAEKELPPQINLEFDAKNPSVVRATVTTRGNTRVAKIGLRQNISSPVLRTADNAKEFTVSWPVVLEADTENRFDVIALDDAGNVMNTSSSVSIRGPTGIRTQKLFDTVHIFAAAVGKYDSLAPLSFAASDAETVAAKFAKSLQPIAKEVKKPDVLSDKMVSEQSLNDAFKRIRTNAGGKNDLAIVFITGHGDVDANNNYRFLFHDCPKDQSKYEQHGFSAKQFENALSELNSLGCVIFLIDTCSAGDLSSQVSGEFVEKANVITFTSSNRKEKAITLSDDGMSYFAYAITQALDGKCNVSKKNELSIVEFEQCVTATVQLKSERDQNPTISWGNIRIKTFPISVFN